jgi:hypothetical protein
MRLLGTIAFLCALAGGLSAQDVRYNFDKSADFSKYKTYKWVQIKDVAQPDQLTDQQLRAAIDVELMKKGLTRTEDDNANLLIGYQVALNQEKQFSSYSSGFGPGWGYGPYWGGGYTDTMTTGQTSTIYVGTVALDMYDPVLKQLVWRGSATKTLDAKAKPEKRQKNIGKGMAKLLKKFPPVQK